jgi:hypothetical protein
MKTGQEYLLDKIGGNNPDKYDQKTIELIGYWMDEYAKHYHELQVNSVDLADVGKPWSEMKEGDEMILRCRKVKGKFELCSE